MSNEINREKEIESKRHFWIQLMGLPASGKTTLGKYISDRLGMDFVGEISVEDVSTFEDYYKPSSKDPSVIAFVTQLTFLFDRRCKVLGFGEKEGVKDMLERGSVISESIYQDRIYAQARLENSPKKMDEYNLFFEGMVDEEDHNPDLLVYIRLTYPTFIKRLINRAKTNPERAVELEEKPEYWMRLRHLFETWITENPLNLNIIIIDGDKYDFSNYENEEDAKKKLLEELTGEMKKRLGGNENIILPEALI
ncbi:deoxynucleoside kinase [Patescibacteria group bacterium]|nr:deoxynucleoside kinase [Patescibacteria group bacterium]MBU0777173.1 deoxynucleoside kinase [Patescibacteria group bacterium]MBU0845868.1 deoxynucleoside kinase [Patescibacteria group bacterium]MBU0922895.1 deoxynucleoside kinase [Patescibacteria group bacterium]MBU1066372.1 deoxynucleoside kinase [Patescibacteria group bacterium]